MRTAIALGFLATIGACASSSPAMEPSPVPVASDAFMLRRDWRTTVIAERDDSIILTMPSGDHQLQRIHRVATFTLTTAANGAVSIHLDSVRTEPVGSSGGAQDVAGLVQQIVPRIPNTGARPNSLWLDSANGPTSTDIFKVSERRNGTWSTGNLTRVSGGQTMAVRLREDFEQIGSGSNDRQLLTYTSQGRRTGTYYVESGGRLLSAQLRDSATISIGVPATRGVMSGTRVTRTEIRFIPLGGEP